MKRAKFYPVVALLLCAAAAAAADLVVIDLRHRTAEEVLPSLRPMVRPDVSLSGIDYKLLVRGEPDDIAKIREVVAVLDRAPRQLLISVRYGGNPQSRTSDAGAGATVDNRGAQVAVRGGVSTSTAIDSNVSSVRVLEGNSAHISAGQSVPVVTAFIPALIVGRHSGVGVATDYRELSSGFEVLPRVNGDRVVLEISTQQERLADSNAGGTNVQRASTVIAGRLGEWLDLGGVTSTMDEQRTTVGVTGGARHVTTQSDQRNIAVRVEQVQ